MNSNAYRKMVDKIHVSDSKRKETAELLNNYDSEELTRKNNKIKLSKWMTKPYIRRYVAAAAFAALVLTGVIIGFPQKSISTAENAASESMTAGTDEDGVNVLEQNPSSESTTDSDMESPTLTGSSPTYIIKPTAPPQIYHMSIEPTFPKTFSFKNTSAKESLLKNNSLDPSFVEAVRNFSWRTSSKLVTMSKPENITYSPASVYMALAMAGTGARGQTQQEFYSLLGVKDISFLSKQCCNLYRRSYFSNEVGTMKMANSLWMNQYNQFEDSYVQNAVNNFYASIYNVDFREKSVGDKISNWISKNTNGILKPEIKTSPDELLSIVNTIYFKDEWVNGFDPKKTKKDTFTMANGKQKTWDFMNETIEAKNFKGSGFKTAALEMKNVGSMVFVLPDEGVKAEDLIKTPEQTAAIFDLSKGYESDVRFSVPKFSMGKSEVQLNDMLKSLGFQSAFKTSADFSGISKTPLCFDHVQHGAHIQIYESGATAAAYTEIGTKATATMPKYMTLNRPFIYAVLSNDGIPLFMGVCQEPVNE